MRISLRALVPYALVAVLIMLGSHAESANAKPELKATPVHEAESANDVEAEPSMASLQSTPNPDVTFTYPSEIHGLPNATDTTFTAHYNFKDYVPDSPPVTVGIGLEAPGVQDLALGTNYWEPPINSSIPLSQVLHSRLNEELTRLCADGAGVIHANLTFDLFYTGTSDKIYVHPPEPVEIPCSVSATPNAPELQAEICGPNNDLVTIHDQPTGVKVEDSGWSGGVRTVTFSQEDWSNFPDGVQTTFLFEDADDPCFTSITIDATDGAFIDAIPVYQVPMTAIVTLDDTHEYESLQLLLYPDREAGLLPYPFGVFNVQPGNGGPYTFEIEYPGTPFGLEAETCVDGVIKLDITARPYHPGTSNPDYDAAFSRTFSFPCSYLVQANPVIEIAQVEVCGPNNDEFAIASQPTGVGYIIHDWADSETSIQFFPEEGYYFWTTGQVTHFFTDDSTPCPTDAPVKPVQAQVCGPDNDEITFPPQPEGVELEHDSGWKDGTRTITFAIDPAFETDGETEFTLTDEGIACPIPSTTLTVQLVTSDGGSLKGEVFRFYAPVASQVVQEPFIEGEIGPGNRVVVEDLIAGTYRIVVNAEGYELIDEMISVTAEGALEEHMIEAVALQPVETPTPEPTVDPTPTVTQESAPVTGLPETGAGASSGLGMLGFAGLLAAVIVGAIGAYNRPVRRR